MPTASTPHCRQVFRTPTFLKSLADLKIKAKEADDIVHFVATNAQSGTVEHRQLGFVLKRLPWDRQLWVQYLEDSSRNIYLLAMTDEDIGPRPPKKNERLTRILDRLWVAAAVRGVEWLGGLLRGLTSTPRRSSVHRINADSQLWVDSPEDGLPARADIGEPMRLNNSGTFYLAGAHTHSTTLDSRREMHQSDLLETSDFQKSSIFYLENRRSPIDNKINRVVLLPKGISRNDANLELRTMWLQPASRKSDSAR